MAIKFGSILHLNNSASEATLDANNLKGSALQIDEFNSASLATIGAGLSTAPGKRRLGTIIATTGSTAIPTAYYAYIQTSSGDVNLSGSEWTTLSNWGQIQVGSSGDTVDLHFSASEGTGFSFANNATASFTSGSGTGLTVTAGSTNNIEFELVGVLSSSAQIASDISGAIDAATGSFSASIIGTANEVEITAPTGQIQIGLPDNVIISGSLQITGSTNITGSVDINIDSGTAFQINEPDEDQPSRLKVSFDDGDPTLSINSRASTATISILAEDSTTNGLHLNEDGVISRNATGGITISETQLKPTYDNQLDLGVWNRKWNKIFTSEFVGNGDFNAIDFRGGNRSDGNYNFGLVNVTVSSSGYTNSSSHYFSIGQHTTASNDIGGDLRTPTVFKVGKSGSLSVNLNQGTPQSNQWYTTASAMVHVESDPNFNMDLFRGDKSINDVRFKVDNEGNTTISGSVSASGLLYISSSQNSGQTYGVLVRDSNTGRVYHTGSYGTGGGGSGDTVDLHFSASGGTGFSFANAATASFESGSAGITVTAGTTNKITIGANTDNVIFNHITASGNISSSGIIIASGADFRDGNITNVGDIRLDTITDDNSGGDTIMSFTDNGISLQAEGTPNVLIIEGASSTFSHVLDVSDTTDASNASGDTGALRVEGGVSIAKKVYIGTQLSVGSHITASGHIWQSGSSNQIILDGNISSSGVGINYFSGSIQVPSGFQIGNGGLDEVFLTLDDNITLNSQNGSVTVQGQGGQQLGTANVNNTTAILGNISGSYDFGNHIFGGISFEIEPALTASIVSASGMLFASLSLDNTNSKTVMYDTSSGKFFFTGSYGGGGGGGGSTPALQAVTTVGDTTTDQIIALDNVSSTWGGSASMDSTSGFRTSGGYSWTHVTPQKTSQRFLIIGVQSNLRNTMEEYPNNYLVFGEHGALFSIGNGGNEDDDHLDGKSALQYQGGAFEIVPSGSDNYSAHPGIRFTPRNISFFNNDASSSVSGAFFETSASAKINFDTGSSAIKFLAGSTTETLKEVLFISKSGDNPRVGVGTSSPKGAFDFKETLDSTTGTELLLRTSRTTEGGQTGDEGGSINFIIDSSSFNNIKTSGSLAKIKTIATTVGTTGVQGKLVLELSKGAISKVDAFEYGYSIGGITGFAQVQTASLVIKDYSEGQESELQMRDFTDNLRFHVFDGGVTMSGSLGVTGSALFNSHITASGNISSSGTIYADSYQVEGNPAIGYSGDTVRFGFANNTPISIGKSGNPIQLVGTLTASDVTLDRIIYNTASSALGSNGAIGDIVKFGNSTTIAGGLYYLKNDGTWDRADADAVGTATGSLAIAVATNSSDGMCLRGFVNPYTDPGAGTGNPVYLSTTYGRMQAAAPTGTGDIVRIVGYQYGTDLIYFNPSNDYIIHA